jgi:hypothetical protein
VGVRLGVKCGGSLTTARGCIFADAADSLQRGPVWITTLSGLAAERVHREVDENEDAYAEYFARR